MKRLLLIFATILILSSAAAQDTSYDNFPEEVWPDQEFNAGQQAQQQQQQQPSQTTTQETVIETQNLQPEQSSSQDNTGSATSTSDSQKLGPIEEKGWYGQTEDKPWYWQTEGESGGAAKSSDSK